MKFKAPLIQGKFLKRYKRFFADVELPSGEIVVAHVPNTGSLKSVNNPGQKCWMSPADNPERKLRYTLEAIETPTGTLAGVNTSWPNQLIAEAFESRKISHWLQFDRFQAEVKLNAETRIDAVLWNSKEIPVQKITPADFDKYKGFHLVEVKNVTLADPEHKLAMFPDAVTERGQKHIRELQEMILKGHTTEIVFTVQRGDCESFTVADSIDPEYGVLLRKALSEGLRVSPLRVQIDPNQIAITGEALKPFNL